MSRILFLTSRFPFPPIGGDKLRTYNFIKHLKKKHQLTIISFIEDEKELNYPHHYNKNITRVITIKLPKYQSYLNCVYGVFTRSPLQIHYYYSSKMKKAIAKELMNNKYDLIIFHLIRMAQYIEEDVSVKNVIDFTDAISLNYHRSKKFQRGWLSGVNFLESKRVQEYELKSISKAYKSIFISKIDAEHLRTENNSEKLEIVQNGVDLIKFSFNSAQYDSNQISFIGNMRTFPNTDAVLYFVKEIFPLIKKIRPKLKFYIVGNEPSRDVLKVHDGKSIFVTGFVDSVISYIEKSVLVVAPMRVGAGIQNKILESLAIGTPVVTTSIGAEGLDSDVLLIANDPQEFSRKILELINNPNLRHDNSINGRKYIEENFNWDFVLKKLDTIIAE